MSRRFYKNTTRTEPNMRKEFGATIDGLFPEIPKGQVHVLRKMKRQLTDPVDSDKYLLKKINDRNQIIDFFVPGEGYLIPCPCIDKTTGEADLDNYCPVCQGEVFLWEEVLIDVYRKSLRSDTGRSTKEDLIGPGLTNIPLMIFYVKSSVDINRADKLVELWTDKEGDPIRPYRRKSLYRPGTVIDLRSDDGKLEYWKLTCYEEQRKFLNGPEG